MQNGWIKWYRQTTENEIFMHDHTAWFVFEVLLAIVDKEKGFWSGGRYQLARKCELSPGTLRHAIDRLKKAEMIDVTPTKRYSKYKVRNWSKFQQTEATYPTEVNSQTEARQKATSEATSEATLTRIKKKNSITNVILVEARRAFDLYIELFNKNPNQTKLTKARLEKLRLRIKQNGYEQLEAAIRATAASDWHRGNNNSGWKADLDYIIRSQEQVERLSQLESPKPKRTPPTSVREPRQERKQTPEEYALARKKSELVRQQLRQNGLL